jgi:serine/threonine-protein kinase HipA
MVENELFCQRLARNAGFPAAAVSLRRVRDLPTVLVERCDRIVTADGRRVRLHQEDLCQALGVDPRRKYQSEGGPGIREVVDLLRRRSAEPLDAFAFLERTAFNVLVGNNDAHAKNTSLLYTSDGIGLAPVYDVVSTVMYPDVERSLAMRIGGHARWDRQLSPRHWWEQMDACRFSTAGAVDALAAVVDRVTRAWDPTVREAEEEGFASDLIPQIWRSIEQMSTALRGVRTYVPKGRRRAGRPEPPSEGR